MRQQEPELADGGALGLELNDALAVTVGIGLARGARVGPT
jgi:hypothetical protein